MAGFSVREHFGFPTDEVWDHLTDFRNAKEWMTGVDGLTQEGSGPLEVGTRLRFRSRGKERSSHVSALVPGRRIALTSAQGGITATYTYSLEPSGDGTEATLDATCEASGIWRLLHPLIVFAMRKSDSAHLANLKSAMERRM